MPTVKRMDPVKVAQQLESGYAEIPNLPMAVAPGQEYIDTTAPWAPIIPPSAFVQPEPGSSAPSKASKPKEAEEPKTMWPTTMLTQDAGPTIEKERWHQFLNLPYNYSTEQGSQDNLLSALYAANGRNGQPGVTMNLAPYSAGAGQTFTFNPNDPPPAAYFIQLQNKQEQGQGDFGGEA